LGTAAVIIALSILAGFEKEIKEKVFGFISHVQVVGFQGQPLDQYEASVKKVGQTIPQVRAITPVVAKEALIRAGENVDGVFLKGIDLKTDFSAASRYIIAGRYLSSQDSADAGMVIGRKLAAKLDVDVGSRVVVLAIPRSAGGIVPRAAAFRVVGIFESGMSEYDDLYAFTTLSRAQALFQLGDAVLGYDILVRDPADASMVAAQVQSALGYPHYARTAPQLYKNLFAWIELQKKPAPIVLGLIIVVATVNIIGTLLMLVLDKMHDIGVLRSLGATPAAIRRVFILHGGLIGVLGIAFGNLLAYALCWVQLTFKPFSLPSDIYYMSSVPILLEPESFVVVSLFALTLCLSAAVLPARVASKIDPIQSLRYG
jgi:lipoprotein-releasing system permease protein